MSFISLSTKKIATSFTRNGIYTLGKTKGGSYSTYGGESTNSENKKRSGFRGVAESINSENRQNIIVIAGAGISTSAGIPDFRSANVGLRNSTQQEKQNFDPRRDFSITSFREDPKKFYELAKPFFSKEFEPTLAHYFIKLLDNKGLLLRHYTQNVDGLERKAGVPDDKLIEAHGTLHTSHCTNPSCLKEYNFDWMIEKLKSDPIPKCIKCDSVIKPDVVLFGEDLPSKFYRCVDDDFPKCDLLIVMGTSLEVGSFASLIDRPSKGISRLLINRELVGTKPQSTQLIKEPNFSSSDAAYLGNCDDGVRRLAKILGWEKNLDNLKNTSNKK